MTRPILAASLCAVTLLGGCAQMTTIASTFDPQEVAWSRQAGTATINGQAFIRQTGGGVVTCAGANVSITPVARYSTERIAALYGNTTQGVNYGSRGITGGAPEGYRAAERTTRCNAQGNFTFNNLPAGEWYATTTVTWAVGYSRQGGHLMQRVRTSPGETTEVLLSP